MDKSPNLSLKNMVKCAISIGAIVLGTAATANPGIPPINNGVFIKEKKPFTESELATIAYSRCLQLLEKGDEVMAAQGLQQIIDQIPNYHPARLRLLKIYRSIGWDSEANNVVDEGLRIDPNNVMFIINKAALLLDKNQSEKALSILLKVPSEQRKNIEYKELLAVSYFKLELYDLASRNYDILVRNNIGNSKWWLGLALSLDFMGNKSGAIKGFERVRTLGGVNPKVLQFVNQRLSVLQGVNNNKKERNKWLLQRR